jgi:hypothetical protein
MALRSVIGQNGHSIRSINLILRCANDEAAKQSIEEHDFRLWQADRRVAEFSTQSLTSK